LACRAKLDIFKVMAPQVLDKYFKKSSEGNNEKDIKMKSVLILFIFIKFLSGDVILKLETITL